MQKKWLLHSLLAGIMTIPLMGFSSPTNTPGETKIEFNQLTLESGGTSVPYKSMEAPPPILHHPEDGIISGAAGCLPDVHVFNKKIKDEHIVFTAGITQLDTREKALALNDKLTISVEISSGGNKILELPFEYHMDPEGKDIDPNTNKPFWVSTLYFNVEGAHPGANVLNLPTGEYEYQFKVKNNEKGHVLDVWVPDNNKFTLVDEEVKK
ncbi:hypothetical protein [Ammoniphilus resinae]|uniref:Uncharacterized protein n=1 Tax=Ammoniphilus resinae TaxID=861532 RepID=A0ABS4GX47_9BACL|nr:hypothetical protein [Ammoniphilus resinae]MBP1934844.1 hypothetical protein [Ammoniphilus resinae]